MAKRERGNRRRGQARARQEKSPVLLVVQGKVTETEYFQRLRETYRIRHLSVVSQPHPPNKIVDKAKNQILRDKNAPFSAAFFVVDVDDYPRTQFHQGFRDAQTLAAQKQQAAFVVSNECFEVWLLAHYEDIRDRSVPRGTLTQKLVRFQAVDTVRNKHLSDSFPIREHQKAASSCDHLAFNKMGSSSKTAIPKLIDFLLRKQ
ncbi:RloB family protein [Corynebacterium ulceribovis]|uniref:RloB family protein n=1 Tax=Corynebacterium ulceribovis TaxID=487732 RepID=UPI00315C5698